MVEDLRKIRDQISNEINGMTFKQERAYLDKLLADKGKSPFCQDVPLPDKAMELFGCLPKSLSRKRE